MEESKASCFRCGGRGYVWDDSGPPESSTSRISCPVCNAPHRRDDGLRDLADDDDRRPPG